MRHALESSTYVESIRSSRVYRLGVARGRSLTHARTHTASGGGYTASPASPTASKKQPKAGSLVSACCRRFSRTLSS